MSRAKRKSCGAELVWVVMESGKRMPVDASTIERRIVVNGDRTKGAIRETGLSHFATCPDANQHRRST